MSRIGKLPVTLIAGVTAEISKDSITVKGAKGTLSFPIYDGVSIVQDGDTLKIEIANTEDAQQKALNKLESDVFFDGDEIQLKLQKAIATLPDTRFMLMLLLELQSKQIKMIRIKFMYHLMINNLFDISQPIFDH